MVTTEESDRFKISFKKKLNKLDMEILGLKYDMRDIKAQVVDSNNFSLKVMHALVVTLCNVQEKMAGGDINHLSIALHKSLVSSSSDVVDGLPGQPPVPFKQYAGYVTVDQRSDRALVYYFVEAETEPDLKPLVFWLSGGPGCSSFGVGALTESGPFQPKGDKLIRNGYSWNKEANVLYLESPAGVGFSYSSDQTYYVGVNDTITANDNLIFLQGWFKKFPEFKTRELYLTGESYAGHYIP